MKATEEWRERALMDQAAGFGLGWPAVVLALLDALEDMTREARLSREATEKAVQSRIARHDLERALRAVSVYDEVASDEDVLFHDGAAHAVRVIREILELDE